MTHALLLIGSLLAAAETPPDPIGVTGREDPRLVSFDRLMIEFLRDNGLPGASLAVARDGKLVYARGFGLADREKRTPVDPDSLFRIASVSKPFTGVAVLQLAERGKLDLDAPAFDLLRPALKGGAVPADTRLREVTVRQLLHHTGGWDRDKSFDPMFRSVEFARRLGTRPPASAADVIRSMISEPLDFAPGTGYSYSNFGYCVLGRVVEAASGKSYADYVKAEILRPCGITDMRIGATLASGRAAREVRYYTQEDRTGRSVVGRRLGVSVPRPYGAWHLEAMDAHGGWIASAIDLARFASALDAGASPALLDPRSQEVLFARPQGPAGYADDGSPKDVYYSCGWAGRDAGNGGRNSWHAGRLDGTASLLVRRHDGLVWAALFNCDTCRDGKFVVERIDGLIHRAADAVREWPGEDRFGEFLEIAVDTP